MKLAVDKICLLGLCCKHPSQKVASMAEESIQSKGGIARAEALSAEQRQEIARKAARARWETEGQLPRATHSGTLKLADIPCHVLENGERILSTRGIMKSLNRTWRGRKYAGTELPVFLEAKNLKPFISAELTPVLAPRNFRTDKGTKGEGYVAEILPAICEIYLRARDEGKLTRPQEAIAKQCEILIRGLSRVGIIALVDEATGYQEVRDRLALQAILDQFLRQEFAAWAKRFPNEFYQHIFRLRGWEWRGMKVNRPQVVASYTKDLVYARLAPGILNELEARNPKDEKGHRKAKHHQWLTEDVGHPALAQHLYAVIGLMRLADSWDQFKKMLDRAYPKRGDTLQMPLFRDAREPAIELEQPSSQSALAFGQKA
jgi:P63C domain